MKKETKDKIAFIGMLIIIVAFLFYCLLLLQAIQNAPGNQMNSYLYNKSVECHTFLKSQGVNVTINESMREYLIVSSENQTLQGIESGHCTVELES
jgi:hypothetical protein